MNIGLIGASGFVGTAIAKEALNRGHQVTAVVRNPEKVTFHHEHLTIEKTDVLNQQELIKAVKGKDAVVSAYNAGWTNPNLYEDFLKGSKAVQSGVKAAGVKRLITIGGAGSLEVAPGVQIVDTPDFPAAYKAGATSARDYLNVLKEEKELDWTFFSPAIEMNPESSGVRKGKYRTSLDTPVFDADHRSILSVEDLAVAIVDELEKPVHIKQRFTAGY